MLEVVLGCGLSPSRAAVGKQPGTRLPSNQAGRLSCHLTIADSGVSVWFALMVPGFASCGRDQPREVARRKAS